MAFQVLNGLLQIISIEFGQIRADHKAGPVLVMAVHQLPSQSGAELPPPLQPHQPQPQLLPPARGSPGPEPAHRQYRLHLHGAGQAAHHRSGVMREPPLNPCGALAAVGQAQRVVEIAAQAAFASAR